MILIYIVVLLLMVKIMMTMAIHLLIQIKKEYLEFRINYMTTKIVVFKQVMFSDISDIYFIFFNKGKRA